MLTIAQDKGNLTVYKNGKLIGSGESIPEIMNRESATIRLGVNSWDAVFDGLVDDVEIYNVALTADQIKNVFFRDVGDMILGQLEAEGIVQNAKEISLGLNEIETLKQNPCIQNYFSGEPEMEEKYIGKVQYTTDSPEIASVDENGTIKGLKKGTAMITVSVKGVTETHTVMVKGAQDELTPLASYPFEGSLGENVKQWATELKETKTEAAFDENGRKNTKAVKLFNESSEGKDDGYGLELPQKNLGSTYTVSLWINPSEDLGTNQQCLFVGWKTPQNWIGIVGDDGNPGKYKVWENHAGHQTATTRLQISQNTWTMLTLSQNGNEVKVYKNGKEAVDFSDKTGSPMIGANQGIYVGVNPFSDDEFDGLMDDVRVYDTALDESQAAAIYLTDTSEEDVASLIDFFGILNKNASLDYITGNLNLPEEVAGINFTWESSAPEKISADGKVNAQDGSKVTLTANASKADIGFTWKGTFEVTLAREVSVNSIDESDDTVIRTDKLYLKEGEKYTHEESAIDPIISTEAAAYKYDKESEKNKYEIAAVGEGADTITIAYKKLAIQSVEPIEDIYVIEGNVPVLPEKATATADDGAPAAGSSGSAQVKVPIIWGTEPDITELKAQKEAYVIKGNAGGKEVQVNVHVYECDESTGEIVAEENSSGHLKANGFRTAYTGKIVTEYDVVVTADYNKKDRVIMYSDTEYENGAYIGNAWKDYAAKLEFGVNDDASRTFFRAHDNAVGYPESADDSFVAKKGETYRVRMEIDNANGKFRTWITAPDGTMKKLFSGEN